jgi:hypothetical protein
MEKKKKMKENRELKTMIPKLQRDVGSNYIVSWSEIDYSISIESKNTGNFILVGENEYGEGYTWTAFDSEGEVLGQSDYPMDSTEEFDQLDPDGEFYESVKKHEITIKEESVIHVDGKKIVLEAGEKYELQKVEERGGVSVDLQTMLTFVQTSRISFATLADNVGSHAIIYVPRLNVTGNYLEFSKGNSSQISVAIKKIRSIEKESDQMFVLQLTRGSLRIVLR